MDRKRKPKAQTNRSLAQEARVTRALELITLIGIYGGILMPLVYARIVIYPFIFLKMLYFQILVGSTFAAWVTLALRDARYRPRASWLLWGLLAWYAVLGLSSAFAVNSWRAIFGTQERMTGLFSLLHFFAWFVMAASMLRSSRDWRRLLEFQIGVGFASACASVLQLLYPSLIGPNEVLEGERLSGLMGNPIFVGAYQAFAVFFVIFLWSGASWRRRSWYGLVLLSALASFVLAGSRGPLLGLMVGLGAAGMTLALTSRHRRFVSSIVIGAPLTVAAYALFVGFVVHRPSLEAFWSAHTNIGHFFDFQLDVSRIRLWTAAWDGFLARPILGWGPVGYELAYDVVYRPSFHAMGINDEAHNRVLGVMCETGFLGLAAFLAMWVGYIVTVVQGMRRGALQPLAAAALVGAGTGHFVQCLFAFDTPATQLMTFLVFAVASAALATKQSSPGTEVPARADFSMWMPPGMVPAVMAAVVVLGSVLPLMASVYTRRASVALLQQKPDEMLALLTRGQRLATPYHDDQLITVTQSILRLVKLKKLEGWEHRKDALSLTHAIAEQYFAKNKAHVRLRRLYANALLAIGKNYDSSKVLGKAESLFRQNLVDSPMRQTYLLDYARFLTETARPKEAEELLRKTVALDPSIGEPRWELGKFTWNQLKRPGEGAQLMADAAVNLAQFGGITDLFVPTKATEWQQLAQACSRTGQIEKLRAIVLAVPGFDKRDRSLAEVYLGIARYMEKSGLLAERDQVLKYGRERNPKLASTVDPVLAGKATLSSQQADSNKNQKAKPAPFADAGKSPTQEAQISLARAP